MRTEWRRQALQLPSVSVLSAEAVRAAYWRQVGEAAGADRERLKDAKRELLFELGMRVPASRKTRPGADSVSNEPASRPSESPP